MKQDALHTLLIAKTLMERAQALCSVDDRYIASAGLVVLQDAVELVIYAALVELEADKKKDIGKLSFDSLLDELRNNKVEVPKASALRALNKQRVIIKHYGQLAEPAGAKGYLDSALIAVDEILAKVVGSGLQGILLSEIIKDDEIRSHIHEALEKLEAKTYLGALASVRKAIYLAVEQDYSIEGWSDWPSSKVPSLFDSVGRGGSKAHHWTRNAEWIEKNVKDPINYVQLDHEKVRLDLMEWGVPTEDFWNLWRLTPDVFRFKESKKWVVKLEAKHTHEAATEQTVRFCIDKASSIILKKQTHSELTRYLGRDVLHQLWAKPKNQATLYQKASTSSAKVGELQAGECYRISYFVTGFDGSTPFILIVDFPKEPKQMLYGYVLGETCDIEESKYELTKNSRGD